MQAGEVVSALELDTTADGSLRIRVDHASATGQLAGWVNLTTQYGATLLRPLNGAAGSSPSASSSREQQPSRRAGASPSAAPSMGTEGMGMQGALLSAEHKLAQLDATVSERNQLLQLKLARSQQYGSADTHEQAPGTAMVVRSSS